MALLTKPLWLPKYDMQLQTVNIMHYSEWSWCLIRFVLCWIECKIQSTVMIFLIVTLKKKQYSRTLIRFIVVYCSTWLLIVEVNKRNNWICYTFLQGWSIQNNSSLRQVRWGETQHFIDFNSIRQLGFQ